MGSKGDGRTQRSCQACGKPFYGAKDSFYCPDCAKGRKSDTAIRIRTCQDCGIEFPGGPRARRCPECAYKAQKEVNKQHKAIGTKRSLGSIDKCAICGGDYTVVSGRQKYCPSCRREGVLEWQREHKRGYSRASGQDIKKMERRGQVRKVCVYCTRSFISDSPTNVCSEYCRAEHMKLTMCLADIKRGRKRDLKKYEDKREQYRKEVENAEPD